MSNEKLTKTDWQDVRAGLMLVPARARSIAWKKLMAVVEKVLLSRSDIAKDYDPDTLLFSINCDLCKKVIYVADNYVVKEGISRHYDCFEILVEEGPETA